MEQIKSRAPVTVPVLDGDKGRTLPPHCYVERRIVAHLIAHMQKRGWQLHSVNDGEDVVPVSDTKSAMEAVFSVDESSLRFWRPWAQEQKAIGPEALYNQYNEHPHIHGVLLVAGNGVDIISDWNFKRNDTDGFSAAMEAFDAEQFQ